MDLLKCQKSSGSCFPKTLLRMLGRLSTEEYTLHRACRVDIPLFSTGSLDERVKEKISVPLGSMTSLLYFEKGNITQ
ncbi:MAG: hypothetical protein ACMUEM_07480 [Flavobacteriales bacterium AspAUS03]